MADDIQLNHGSGTTVSFTGLGSLADGSNVSSTAFDLGAQSAHRIGLEIKLDGNSASNTGFCIIKARWSGDNTDYADVENAERVGAVLMNGTTAVICWCSMPVRARYCQITIENESGAALASSGNSVTRFPMAVDQA